MNPLEMESCTNLSNRQDASATKLTGKMPVPQKLTGKMPVPQN
ncbi:MULTISPECIES: hypothetical protein [unclassified Microcoleus]|nr:MULTISPECIES: hypothetical protein [unclassified Microcoleus]